MKRLLLSVLAIPTFANAGQYHAELKDKSGVDISMQFDVTCNFTSGGVVFDAKNIEVNFSSMLEGKLYYWSSESRGEATIFDARSQMDRLYLFLCNNDHGNYRFSFDYGEGELIDPVSGTEVFQVNFCKAYFAQGGPGCH